MKSGSTSAKGTLGWALAFALGLGAVAAPQAKAQTFTVIRSFTGGSDGADPLSGLFFAGGNLFGTASSGGSSGLGVVFRLSLSGQETVLHEFTGGTDGANPQGRLVMDKAGNFYGTTTAGGVSNAGTVFKVTRRGKETILYSFTGKPDGANPVAGLAIDSAGNLYGTTTAGGANGNGTVFKLAIPTVSGGEWTEEVLYSFGKSPDGTVPVAGVTFDSSGNLYGTTSAGGTSGYGTVFQLTPSGSAWTETILHHFALKSDGGIPYAGLVLDSNGNLYGAATEGGAGGQNGGGTIFELNAHQRRRLDVLRALRSIRMGHLGEFPQSSAGIWQDLRNHPLRWCGQFRDDLRAHAIRRYLDLQPALRLYRWQRRPVLVQQSGCGQERQSLRNDEARRGARLRGRL
jgi:uncharacterized repeat protein (TIGR03803 family)